MITFCGFSYRSSGIVRGMQLAARIDGSKFLDIDALNYAHPQNNVVIYVRKFDENHAKFCKNLNLKVGYDVADNPVTDFLYGRVKEDDFSRYTHPTIDFYIVNNDVVLQKLQQHTDKKIYVIPHHNCNFDKVHNRIQKPKTIGYIGLPEQSISQERLDDICKKFGLTFVVKDVTEHSKLDFAFSQIDIGLVFFEKDNEKLKKKILDYKPGTKLSNFQSYGIPTICLPYESFKQFGENNCYFIDKFEEIEDHVANLVNDHDVYSSMSKNSILTGEKLHIDNVTKYYTDIVADFSKVS